MDHVNLNLELPAVHRLYVPVESASLQLCFLRPKPKDRHFWNLMTPCTGLAMLQTFPISSYWSEGIMNQFWPMPVLAEGKTGAIHIVIVIFHKHTRQYQATLLLHLFLCLVDKVWQDPAVDSSRKTVSSKRIKSNQLHQWYLVWPSTK